MKLQLVALGIAALLMQCFASTEAAPQKSSLKFRNVEYFHRWSKGTQHEYTPKGQQDLKKWTDMVTLNYYPNAKDGEALAKMANRTISNYESAKGRVLRTNSIPATSTRAAEHLIVVAFGQPTFVEIAFARFRMHHGIGTSIVYSHRRYGKNVGKAMGAWLQSNAPKIESDLMKWNAMPNA